MNQPKTSRTGIEHPKERVTSAHITVTGSRTEPYYEIEYVTLDGETHIGYGSYCLDYVSDWLGTCFEYCEVRPCQGR